MTTQTESDVKSLTVNRINKAIRAIPVEIAHIVKSDVDNRMTDWLLSGGTLTDEYIEVQVQYVERIAQQYVSS